MVDLVEISKYGAIVFGILIFIWVIGFIYNKLFKKSDSKTSETSLLPGFEEFPRYQNEGGRRKKSSYKKRPRR
jgi:hypothetical protein